MTAACLADMDLQTLFEGLAASPPSRDVVDLTLDSRRAPL